MDRFMNIIKTAGYFGIGTVVIAGEQAVKGYNYASKVCCYTVDKGKAKVSESTKVEVDVDLFTA